MKTIEQALDEAYKNAGSNAYFGNGFRAGIEFAQQLQFKNIQNYNGFYEISNFGDIKSKARISKNNKNKNDMYLSRHINKNGYVHVGLTDKFGVRKNYDVHRLVALAFVDNPNGYNDVNHIDGNKQNNVWTNLEWVTRSENQKHAYRIGLQKPNKYWEGKKGEYNKSSKKVECISDGKKFVSIKEASNYYKVQRCSISLVCRGKLKTTGKLKFKFIGDRLI